MSYAQACLLGVIQGLTEFLPISSSAHLALTPWFLGWADHGMTFDVALHMGTLLAVSVYFLPQWMRLLRGAVSEPRSAEANMLFMLVSASIPAAVVGLLFEKRIEANFRSPVGIAALLIIFGLVMAVADRFGRRARSLADFTWPGAMFVGCAQALALMPGVSRSGVTIAAALLLGLTRDAAAQFSFMLATPIVIGAGLFKLRHLAPAEITGPFVVGMAVSALTGAAAIHFFLSRLPKFGLWPYVVYRLALAGIILATAVLR